MDPLGWKIIPKYLGHRWSHSREKNSLNILDTDGPTWVKTEKHAKKNKSNKNIYKQKQTNEKTGENNKLAK